MHEHDVAPAQAAPADDLLDRLPVAAVSAAACAVVWVRERAQRVGLRLAAAFGHRLGEVGEQHREPEPERELEREAESRRARPRCPGPAPAVVSTLPTSTTNITGFRTMCRGSSLTNASRIARRTIGRSNSGSCWSRPVSHGLRSSLPAPISRCSTIGPSESAGKKVSAPTIRITADQQHDEQRRRDRERARRLRHDLPLGQEPRQRQHRHDHREPAEQRRQAEQRVVVVGRPGQAGEGAAVVAGRRGEGVQDLGQAVRARRCSAPRSPGREQHRGGGEGRG